MIFATGLAHATCKSVDGRIVSQLVSMFSDGTPCPSLLGLCTEGRFTGDLKGRFTFVANALAPYTDFDPTAPPDVAATTGVVELRPRKFCRGKLVLSDTSSFSLSSDGSVGGIETVDGGASSGGCKGVSGRIRIEGIFQEGCVDCSYAGEICGVAEHDDDDDDDEDD